VNSSSGLGEWGGRAATAVLLMLAAMLVGLALLGVSLAGRVARTNARHGDSVPPNPSAPAAAAEGTPSESDFPVGVGGRRLLGAYLKGTGAAFVVLESLTEDRIAGISPPPEGQYLFGLRLGMATDSEKPIDADLFSFSLEDGDGRLSPAITVATTGRLLPGPDLNVIDVYFALDRDRLPKYLVVDGPRSTRLLLPAQVVESERGGESGS
jgi:hypothetical protein